VHIEVSMLEIYNEQVRDLFSVASKRSGLSPVKGGAAGRGSGGGGGGGGGDKPQNLKIRDLPKSGPVVQGLTKIAVDSHEMIASLMRSGTAARTTGRTKMNATSSRSHTIFQLNISTKRVSTEESTEEGGDETTTTIQKTSVINLIDLAGSERASRTGATKDRLKEVRATLCDTRVFRIDSDSHVR
jgi:kinesin family protein 1